MVTTISSKPHIMPTSLFCLCFLWPQACLGERFVPRPHFAFCMRACLCAYLREDWKLSLSISAAPLQIRPLKSFSFICSRSAKEQKHLVLVPLQSPSFRVVGVIVTQLTMIMKTKMVPLRSLNDLPQLVFI